MSFRDVADPDALERELLLAGFEDDIEEEDTDREATVCLDYRGKSVREEQLQCNDNSLSLNEGPSTSEYVLVFVLSLILYLSESLTFPFRPSPLLDHPQRIR